MPALQPPSMQIGALPPGASTLTPQPAGPALAAPYLMRPPAVKQSQLTATTAAAPASVSATLPGASTAGNLLVAICGSADSASGPTTTFPAGWQFVRGSSNAAENINIFIFPNNPGGISSVNITLGNINGIVVALLELQNFAYVDTVSGGSATNSAGTAAPQATVGAVSQLGGLIIGALVFSSAASISAFTGTSNLALLASASSTTGATNATLAVYTGPSQIGASQVAATLNSSVFAGGIIQAFGGAGSGQILYAPSRAYVVDQGAGYSSGDGGLGGWALGGTKPGGAGGGQ